MPRETGRKGGAEMRFVHTADWQLGMTRYFLNGEAQPRYSAARRDVVAGRVAGRDAGAEFVVVAGDVFEAQPARAARRQPVAGSHARHRHSGVPAAGQSRSAGCGVGVHQRAVHRRMPRERHGSRPARACTRCGRGLQIVAAPWRPRRRPPTWSPRCSTDLPADGVTRIVVGHGAVDIFVPDKDKPSLIRLAALEAAIARGAVHYVALGDKHSRMQVGTTGRIWYSGSPEVTNYDDIEPDPGSRAGRRHRRGRSPAAGARRRATSAAGGSSRCAAPWTAVATWPTSTSTST